MLIGKWNLTTKVICLAAARGDSAWFFYGEVRDAICFKQCES